MTEKSVDEIGETQPTAGLPNNQRNTAWYTFLGVALVLAAIVAVILVSGVGGTDNGGSSVLDPAPDFSFTLYQGQTTLGAPAPDLSELRGRPVVINFWAGLCPPCRAEMPDLQEFYEDFKDQVTLVGVDLGQFTGLGNQQDARNLLTELGVTYPTGFTKDGSVVSQYRVVSMPTTIFINSRGEVFRRWSGALNRDVLAEVTGDMLDQEPGALP